MTENRNYNPQHWRDLHFKDKASYTTALVAFILGFILLFAGFIINPAGEIDPSVLGGFGTCLIYTASIFGIAMYVKNSMIDVRADVTARVQQEMEDYYRRRENKPSYPEKPQTYYTDNLGNGKPEGPVNGSPFE